MPSAHTQRDAVVVIRLRRAKNGLALRSELRKASRQQRIVAQAGSYHQRNYTVGEETAHDATRRKANYKSNDTRKDYSLQTDRALSHQDEVTFFDSSIASNEQVSHPRTSRIEMKPSRQHYHISPSEDCGKPKRNAAIAKRKSPRDQQLSLTVEELVQNIPQTEDVKQSFVQSGTKDWPPERKEPAFESLKTPVVVDIERSSHPLHTRDVSSVSSNLSCPLSDLSRPISDWSGSCDPKEMQSRVISSLSSWMPLGPSGLSRVLDVDDALSTHPQTQECVHSAASDAGAISDFSDFAKPASLHNTPQQKKSSMVRTEQDQRHRKTGLMYYGTKVKAKARGLLRPTDKDYVQKSSNERARSIKVGPKNATDSWVNTKPESRRPQESVLALLWNRRKNHRRAKDPAEFEVQSYEEVTRWRRGVAKTASSITTTEVDDEVLTHTGSYYIAAEAPGDSHYYHRSSISPRLGGFAEAGGGTCRRQKYSPLGPRSPQSGPLCITEIDGNTRYEMEAIQSQRNSGDMRAETEFVDRVHSPYCSGTVIADVTEPKYIPRLDEFRTKEDLCRYLNPGPDEVPLDSKQGFHDRAPDSESTQLPMLEDCAELPAYQEAISTLTEMPPKEVELGKERSKVTDHSADDCTQKSQIKPEDMWLYSPRSCTTCGDFGTLPLHYCIECKKLRTDMCSDCYKTGHDSCPRDGHQVTEKRRVQDFLQPVKTVCSSVESSSASASRLDANALPFETMDKLLDFVAEERRFMREEMKHARSENRMADQLAAQDREEAAAFRVAKLRLLPNLITESKTQRSHEEGKPSGLLINNVVNHPNVERVNASQPNDDSKPQISEVPEYSTNENKKRLEGSETSTARLTKAPSLPKLSSPSADIRVALCEDEELVDMDAILTKQERFQSFRERELCLREKELSLRERDLFLQSKERQLLDPGYSPTHALLELAPGHSISATTTIPLKDASVLAKLSTETSETPTEPSSTVSESLSACSELSMTPYSAEPAYANHTQSPVVPRQDRFHLNAILVKRILSNLFSYKSRKGVRTHTGKRSRQSGASEHGAKTKKSHSSPSGATRKRGDKALLSRSHSARSDQSGTDSGSHKRRKKSSTMRAVSDRLLACPYAKFDPFRYSGNNLTESEYRRCSSHWLRDIPRLKQHLYRVHRRPEFHCPRCYLAFESKTEVDTHARLPDQCTTTPCPFPEKFDNDQLRELKKRQQGRNEEESWFFIFKVLFPDARPPADPYLEDFTTQLATQLRSLGASQSLGNMVVARLTAQYPGAANDIGVLNRQIQLQVRQAIEASLPELVQQMQQRLPTSTNSSSTSLDGSSNTPGSSPEKEPRLRGDHVNLPGLHQNVHTGSVRTDGYPNDTSLSTFNYPVVVTKGFVSPDALAHPTAPSTMVDFYTCNDEFHHSQGNPAVSLALHEGRRRQVASMRRLGSGQRIRQQDSIISVPTSQKSESDCPVASSFQASTENTLTMTKLPIPQRLALQRMNLEPKNSRRSMDSGYASMHTRQSDKMNRAESSIYHGNTPQSSDSLLATDYPGSAFQTSGWSLESPKWLWNGNDGTSQISSSFNGPLSDANHQNLPLDPSGSIMYSTGQDSAMPGSYQQEVLNLQPTLDVSDPCLPSMSNVAQDNSFAGPSEYKTIDGSWADDNPWVQYNAF